MGSFSAHSTARILCVAGATALLGLSTEACAHIKMGGAREVAKEQATGRSVTEAELKADLHRFTQMYFDRSGEALERMEPTLPADQRVVLLRRLLIYESSALSIATGPVPAVNMLDMLVFTRLTRETFESYWGPKVFGPQGAPLLEVLQQAEAEIWASGRRLLTDEQEQSIEQMIEAWKRANPDRTRVELVRFEQFSKLVGKAAVEKTTSGALGSVTAMGQTADAAVLLGERALFLGQFMPTLLRVQARIGALEMLSDTGQMLSGQTQLVGQTEQLLQQASALADQAQALAPLLGQVSSLTMQLERVTQEAQRLSEALEPTSARLAPLLALREDAHGKTVTGLEQALERGNELSERSLALVQEVRSLVPPDTKKRGALDVLAAELDRGARRLLGYLLLLGVAWAVFFWGGYYLVRRLLEPASGSGAGRRGHGGARPSSVS